MLQLRIENAEVELGDVVGQLAKYTEHLSAIRKSKSFVEPESSINLSLDNGTLERVRSLVAQKVTDRLRYSIVVGIGGSNLGTKAVYDAALGYSDLLNLERFPRLLFAETTDPEWLSQLVLLVGTLNSPDELLVTLISKSGGTTETIANFEILMQAMRKKFGSVEDRVVAITDEGSKLWEVATTKKIECVAIPAQVGGRYSVLSAVGLLPLHSIGMDIDGLLHGADKMLTQCLEGGDNVALTSAAVLFLQQKGGRHINDNFFFHPELESLGKWYRQLMGESVGKEKSLTGETVHAGITPTVSLGSTDLHSVGQLYLGGPKDKITTFIASSSVNPVAIPEERYFPELVPMVSGKSAADVMEAIFEGVKVAYRKAELPFMEVILDAIDETAVGAYMQFKMLEMMYLGQLLNVNSFDQPNVEAYKVETKRLLEV